MNVRRWLRHRYALAVVVTVVSRVAWIALTARRPTGPTFTDPHVYQIMGEKVAHAREFGIGPFGSRTSFLSVAYPSLIGLMSLATAQVITVWGAAMTLNVVAAVALVVGCGVLAERLSGSATAGLVAAWIVVLLPDFTTGAGLVMTELLGAALLVWLAVAISSTPLRWPVVAALLAGVVAIRPSLQLLVVVVPALVWLARRDLRRAALVLVAAGALLSPLAVWSTFGVGVPGLTSATWINICDGVAAEPGVQLTGSFVGSARCRPPLLGLDEEHWSASAKDVATKEIGEHPWRMARLVPSRLRVTFYEQGWGIEVAQNWSGHLGPSWWATQVRTLSTLSAAAVATAGAVGLWRLRRAVAARVAGWMAAASLVGIALTFGAPRYAVPCIVLVLVPAAACLVTDAAGAQPFARLTGLARGRSLSRRYGRPEAR